MAKLRAIARCSLPIECAAYVKRYLQHAQLAALLNRARTLG
jgi:hypothetical protein